MEAAFRSTASPIHRSAPEPDFSRTSLPIPTRPTPRLYPLFNPVLLPYDLTRGGTLFPFVGHTDVKELAMYVQDTITKRNWTFNLGHSRRPVQRTYHRQPGGAAPGNLLQHPEDQHRSARLLCAHAGDAFQREPGALQHRMQLAGAESASGLLIQYADAARSRLSQ